MSSAAAVAEGINRSYCRLVAQRQVGTRRIYGTDWPVTNSVTRVAIPGRRVEWVVTLGECNGTAEVAIEYRTRRDALAELDGHGGVAL